MLLWLGAIVYAAAVDLEVSKEDTTDDDAWRRFDARQLRHGR